MSVTTFDAFFGQATQMLPSGATARPSGVDSALEAGLFQHEDQHHVEVAGQAMADGDILGQFEGEAVRGIDDQDRVPGLHAELLGEGSA